MPLDMLIDSGATASVIPERLLQGYPIRQGEAAKRGVKYLVADGGSVPNLGEMRVNLITQERHTRNATYLTRTCLPKAPLPYTRWAISRGATLC